MLTNPIVVLLYRIEDFIHSTLVSLGVPSVIAGDFTILLEGLLSAMALACVVAVPVIVFLLLLKLIWRLTNALYS